MSNNNTERESPGAVKPQTVALYQLVLASDDAPLELREVAARLLAAETPAAHASEQEVAPPPGDYGHRRLGRRSRGPARPESLLMREQDKERTERQIEAAEATMTAAQLEAWRIYRAVTKDLANVEELLQEVAGQAGVKATQTIRDRLEGAGKKLRAAGVRFPHIVRDENVDLDDGTAGLTGNEHHLSGKLREQQLLCDFIAEEDTDADEPQSKNISLQRVGRSVDKQREIDRDADRSEFQKDEAGQTALRGVKAAQSAEAARFDYVSIFRDKRTVAAAAVHRAAVANSLYDRLNASQLSLTDVLRIAYQKPDYKVIREASEELAATQAALRRIAAGTYGLCQRCNGEIDLEKLEAQPTTAHCMACAAAQTEAEGQRE